MNFREIVMFVFLLYFLIAASAVCCTNFEEAIAFECDKLTDILCLERQYILYCTTTNVLKWKIPCEFRDSKQELDFNNLNDVGAYKTCCSFRADLVNKSGMTLTSSLTFTMELEHNNTNITCLNGWTGENDACYITMAGKASEPLNVSAVKINGTMTLKWEPPNYSGGVPIDCYDVTVSPHDDGTYTNSGNISTFVHGTDTTINGLGCSSYDYTVQAKNCIGQGSSFKNSTYSGLPRKVLNLNSNTENGSIQWDQPYNGGENISHYTVSHVFGSETWNTTQTFFCFLVLSSGEYNISVQAVNCHGKGEPIFISIKVEHSHYYLSALYVIPPAFVIIIIIIANILAVYVFKKYYRQRRRKYVSVNGTTAQLQNRNV